MDQKMPDWNPPPVLNPAWIEYVDSLYLSPAERAKGVHVEIDPNVLQFDLLCFCVEYASGLAVGLFSDTDLYDAMKTAARWLYASHYYQAPEIHGPPDRGRDGILSESLSDKPTLRDLQASADGAGDDSRLRTGGLGGGEPSGVPAEGGDVRGSVQHGVRAHSPVEGDPQAEGREQRDSGDAEVQSRDDSPDSTDPAVGEVREPEVDDNV